MPLWGSIDQANSAPKYKILATSPNTGVQLYGNTVVGIDDGEAASGNVTHPGWVRVIRGHGPVVNVAVNAAGNGYSNTDTVNISGGTTNAVATIATNGNGAIQSVTLTTPGAGFTNTSTAVAAVQANTGAASAGTGGTFTVTLGGRAGRVTSETLVAMGSMTGNGSSAVL